MISAVRGRTFGIIGQREGERLRLTCLILGEQQKLGIKQPQVCASSNTATQGGQWCHARKILGNRREPGGLQRGQHDGIGRGL
jgi:hypothetical protein